MKKHFEAISFDNTGTQKKKIMACFFGIINRPGVAGAVL